ncbi:MAG: hypothetical protein ACRDHG_03875, partial [Anaerolineales bacterium]
MIEISLDEKTGKKDDDGAVGHLHAFIAGFCTLERLPAGGYQKRSSRIDLGHLSPMSFVNMPANGIELSGAVDLLS